jgi:hypothetical protein
MSERIACCVPFCRRTAARLRYPDAEEIICGKHFRTTSGTLRRRMTKIRRAWKRELARNDTFANKTIERLWALDNELWRRIKRQAIELAVGL